MSEGEIKFLQGGYKNSISRADTTTVNLQVYEFTIESL